MEVKVKQFLEDIKEEFCWILYSQEYEEKRFSIVADNEPKLMRASFPYCCALSSQIVGSFLAAHDVNCKAFMTYNWKISHSWCEVDTEIVDYTFFQFEVDTDINNRMKDFKMPEDEFRNIIKKQNIFCDPIKHQAGADFIPRKEMQFLALKEAQQYEFTPDDFYKFARKVLADVQVKTNY